MTDLACAVDGCGQRVKAKGLCSLHYQRRRRGADLTGEPSNLPNSPDRVWARIDIRGPDECWPWQGHTNPYGTVNYRGVRERVPRLILTWTDRGPKPGEQARHSCDNPPCCNPAHLCWGSAADNQRDAVERGRHRTGRESRVCCVRGHAFDESNTRIDQHGNRQCRECDRARMRQSRQRRKKVAS